MTYIESRAQRLKHPNSPINAISCLSLTLSTKGANTAPKVVSSPSTEGFKQELVNHICMLQ